MTPQYLAMEDRMSYAEYNARNWAGGRTDDEIREEIARVEHKALHHKYDWQEVGCAHFDYVRADTLRAILAERGVSVI